MVEKDYTDPETGLRFVEDIRGNLHLVHTMGDMNMSPVINVEPPIVNIPAPIVNLPAPIVNVSSPEVNVPAPVVNVEGGGTTNNYNTTNNYGDIYINSQRIIAQNKLIGFTWASTTSYNRIPNNSGGFINYTVPFGKEYHINNIVAGQVVTGNGGLSYIGIFIDGNILLELPLISEMTYEFESPIKIPATTFVEFKFLPNNKKTDLGITIIGHTI